MANATLSRPGAINNTTGSYELDNALFLKVFSGEVLTAFTEKNIFKERHLERTIDHGKSASFPATWKATARYHTPGTPVLGSNQFKHNERIIAIDDILLADVFIYSLDELKNHYDIRGIYSDQLGAALAREYDKRLARLAVLAARASATVDGAYGGTQLKNSGAGADAEILSAMLFSAAQTLDEKDIPEDDRFAVFRPAQYYQLVQNLTNINKDWGGLGAYADGKVVRIAGIEILKSNNLPSDNYAGVTGERNTYTGDFTDTLGVVFNRQAIGTVKLQDLVTQKTGNDFEVMYQGTLLVAKYAMGHGILRPECAVELSKAA